MENEIYTFKQEIKKIITVEEQKVWLAEKYGKRIEYLFKVGEEQFSPPQRIVQAEQYVLFGQNVAEIKKVLRRLFFQHLTSELE